MGEDITNDQDVIKEIVGQQYKDLYQEMEAWLPKLDRMPFNSIDRASAAHLEWQFEKEEILQAPRNMDGDKEPGSDGFSFAFFQACWSVFKGDIMHFFSEFHTNCVFEKSSNAVFVTLIPKKAHITHLIIINVYVRFWYKKVYGSK